VIEKIKKLIYQDGEVKVKTVSGYILNINLYSIEHIQEHLSNSRDQLELSKIVIKSLMEKENNSYNKCKNCTCSK
jgi:hypothetical protein